MEFRAGGLKIQKLFLTATDLQSCPKRFWLDLIHHKARGARAAQQEESDHGLRADRVSVRIWLRCHNLHTHLPRLNSAPSPYKNYFKCQLPMQKRPKMQRLAKKAKNTKLQHLHTFAYMFAHLADSYIFNSCGFKLSHSYRYSYICKCS